MYFRRTLAIFVFLILIITSFSQIGHAEPPHLLGRIVSDTVKTLFGYHITPLGDQNNDGYDDIMIWDYRFSNYICYGGNPFDTAAAFRIDSVNGGYNIGDINGDGYDDMAMNGRDPSHWKMNVYFGGPAMDTVRDLFFGLDTSYPIVHPVIRGHDINSNGTDELISRDEEHWRLLFYELGDNPDSIQDLIITPANIPWDGYEFGEGLISGDFNGDGYPDLTANLRRAGQQHINGSLYLYWGGAGFDTIPDLIIRRPGEYQSGYEMFGMILESLGDINGDGYDDFFASSGVAYDDTLGFIYFGGPGIDTLPDIIPAAKRFKQARLAGDLNGDTINDLIFSYGVQYMSLGYVQILLGGPNMDSIPDFIIYMQDLPYNLDKFGMDCAGIGDFNGDGVNDIAFSAIDYSNIVTFNRGVVVIYSGWTKPNDVDYEYNPIIPDEYNLSQNYPNPFNSETTIQFTVPLKSQVKLAIYDILGREIYTIINKLLPAGEYKVQWNGRNQLREEVATGIYLCILKTGSIEQSIKLILLK